MTLPLKAEFRSSAEHPDKWEVWHSRDGGESWTFDRLEPKRVEPTDEQLERLTLALGLPTLPPGLRPPYWRKSMLNLHGMVQKAATGDPEANAALARLRRAFAGGVPS